VYSLEEFPEGRCDEQRAASRSFLEELHDQPYNLASGIFEIHRILLKEV
jgi:hypothetical protein